MARRCGRATVFSRDLTRWTGESAGTPDLNRTLRQLLSRSGRIPAIRHNHSWTQPLRDACLGAEGEEDDASCTASCGGPGRHWDHERRHALASVRANCAAPSCEGYARAHRPPAAYQDYSGYSYSYG